LAGAPIGAILGRAIFHFENSQLGDPHRATDGCAIKLRGISLDAEKSSNYRINGQPISCNHNEYLTRREESSAARKSYADPELAFG